MTKFINFLILLLVNFIPKISSEDEHIETVSDISDAIMKDADMKLKEFLKNNKIETLPLHSREVKPATCGEGVEEDTRIYRFDFEDLNGVFTKLLVPQVNSSNSKLECRAIIIFLHYSLSDYLQ